jgi:hypothetical protein
MILLVMTSYTFGIVFSFWLVVDMVQERQRTALRRPVCVKVWEKGMIEPRPADWVLFGR